MCDQATVPLRALTAAPAQGQICTLTLPGQSAQIGRVRALLSAFLNGFPAADDAVLLASELCANACLHSASGLPGGTFTVRARLCGAYLHAEVEDQGSGWDGHLVAAETPHGLYLLRTLSVACGTLPGVSGWVTWFVVTSGIGPEGVSSR
jgi:hypothetical protein